MACWCTTPCRLSSSTNFGTWFRVCPGNIGYVLCPTALSALLFYRSRLIDKITKLPDCLPEYGVGILSESYGREHTNGTVSIQCCLKALFSPSLNRCFESVEFTVEFDVVCCLNLLDIRRQSSLILFIQQSTWCLHLSNGLQARKKIRIPSLTQHGFVTWMSSSTTTKKVFAGAVSRNCASVAHSRTGPNHSAIYSGGYLTTFLKMLRYTPMSRNIAPSTPAPKTGPVYW